MGLAVTVERALKRNVVMVIDVGLPGLLTFSWTERQLIMELLSK